MTWGPFRDGLDPIERAAQLRSLRCLCRVLLGPRGRDAGFAILRAEISGYEPDLLAAAQAEIDQLATLDKRRLLASFSAINFEKPVAGTACIPPALSAETR